MGSHAKPRNTGRRTALSALALGATLTGVGLTAAALDPATAVFTALGADDGGATQLSGLSTPVGSDLSPVSYGVDTLTSAPAGNVSGLTNMLNGGANGALRSAGSLAKTATSGTLNVSNAAAGTQNSVKPIRAGTPVSAGGSTAASPAPGSATPAPAGSAPSSGYTGKHAATRSAAPPSAIAPLADEASSGAASTASSVLPLAQSLVSKVPVVSSLVQGSGVAGTVSGVLGTATGTVGGTVDGASGSSVAAAGDPVAGAVGGLPLVGQLLGGSGDGRSTVTVPGLSALSGAL